MFPQAGLLQKCGTAMPLSMAPIALAAALALIARHLSAPAEFPAGLTGADPAAVAAAVMYSQQLPAV
jgi:hypothetical protein